MKLKEKMIAIELRKKGFMLPAIKKRLNVSKSTLSTWLRGVPLTDEQQERLLKGRDRSRFEAGKAKTRKRLENTQKLFIEGKKEAIFAVGDPFFVAGVMLYWAEGAKSNESIKFSNSDPIMIRLMMLWFRKICRVPLKKFRISIHIHSLHSRPNAESYWSGITGVPRNQFYKTQIKKTSLGHRRNILYEGTCTICVGSKSLFRKMQGWRAGILEKFGKNVKV